jgi:hypothetical protein
MRLERASSVRRLEFASTRRRPGRRVIVAVETNAAYRPRSAVRKLEDHTMQRHDGVRRDVARRRVADDLMVPVGVFVKLPR